jgi:neutral ceramidase
MGGHSIAGQISRGYWTRLQARAVYLEDHEGRPLLLVACDLWSMPGGLVDRVAEILSKTEATRHIPRSRLVVAATHTHQSPGNFSTAKTYNQFGSKASGFDPALFEFLAGRIAEAGVRAAAGRRPAVLVWAETDVGGIMRNRSLGAFRENAESVSIVAENAGIPAEGSPVYHEADEFRAVDPRLRTLALVAADDPTQVIGIAAFIAVHATSMTAETPVYNGDLFGVATVTAERALVRDHRATPGVVALFNGAEGDISPAWRLQDRSDAVPLGRRVGAAITGTLGRGLAIDGAIIGRFERVPFAGVCLSNSAECVARSPLAGVGALGGAEDGRTWLYRWGWREGVTGPVNDDQGDKTPALGFITSLLARPSTFPDRMPLGVYGIGPVLIATLPGEFTVTMGRRIEQAIGATMTTARHVVLIGLANEYLSYFTTPKEYARQHYEGASTMFGPASAPFVKEQLARLANELGMPEPVPTTEPYVYQPGRSQRFSPIDAGQLSGEWDASLGMLLRDPASGVVPDRVISFCWSDTTTVLALPYRAGVRVTSRVSVLDDDTGQPVVIDGIAEDDTNTEFLTFITEADAQTSRWCTIWLRPSAEWGVRGVRLRVETPGGDVIVSTLSSLPDAPSTAHKGESRGGSR